MAYDINKVLSVSKAEVGYLEKKSNSNLSSKTANAGYNNYTKYASDFDTKYPNFYNGKKNGFEWCDIFVDWCFVTAYGVDAALKLLGQPKKSCGAGCDWSAKYYKQIGRFYTSPKVGDQIFFKGSDGTPCHTGLVYKVDSTYVYTREGNTSSASGVVSNGGCVAEKKYKRNSSYIYGYGRPNYGTQATTVESSSTTKKSEVVKVKVTMQEIYKGNSSNSKGQVRTLQRLLRQLGYVGKDGKKLTIDGDFGTNTEYAAKAYQKAKSLIDDGIFGQKSWNSILCAVD
jgi:hypothetical protein